MKDKIKVLILEDVPLDAELVERELKKEGLNYIPLIVDTENDFLNALSVFKPDIILADHSLPHFDGLSALKITLEKSPHIPFIFVSGKIGEDFAVEMLKEGATDYVLKNNLSKLPHSVIRALKESEEQRERQIAEKALKKREEEYRLLVENQTDLIIKLDLEGRLLFISKSFCEIFSQKEEDLLGENFLNLLPHNNRHIMQNFLERLCKAPYSGLIEQEIFTKDGTQCISWANKAVLDKEGKVISIVGVGRDITRQKKAEKALKDSESKYRAIFENTGTLTLIFEKDMTISLVNSEFLKFSGYSQKEVECKLSWLDFVAPEDIERMEGYHRILRLNSSAIPKNYEVSLVNKDGEKKNFFANFDMIPGTNQGLISFMDITDRKIAENKIKRSLKEKELLLREIHHRVKNNLQIISTLLTLQSAQIKDQKVIDLYKESQNRIQSMALIHEKLYQSQEISRINLPDYVQTLVSDLFFSYGTDKELIEPVLDVDDVSMGIDTAIPCGFIINELVSNSLKYAFPEGEGKINVSLHKLSDGNYSLKIFDDGIGLPQNLDIRKTDTLGLQIVNNLVNQIDGKLEIERPSSYRILFKELKYKKRI